MAAVKKALNWCFRETFHCPDLSVLVCTVLCRSWWAGERRNWVAEENKAKEENGMKFTLFHKLLIDMIVVHGLKRNISFCYGEILNHNVICINNTIEYNNEKSPINGCISKTQATTTFEMLLIQNIWALEAETYNHVCLIR